MIRKIGIVLLIAFIAIQFFRPERNNSTAMLSTDITRLYAVPQNIQQILQKACTDCHSNNTEYPWYNYIQPMAWFLQDHINEGKKELNYSEFGTYRIARQNKKMDETIKEIKDNDMPLSSYTFMHPSARLTDAEKEILYDWCKSIQENLKATYPADSLLIKK
ncbi:MAG: heme-binding domain-containing protein [Puia sp.]